MHTLYWCDGQHHIDDVMDNDGQHIDGLYTLIMAVENVNVMEENLQLL